MDAVKKEKRLVYAEDLKDLTRELGRSVRLDRYTGRWPCLLLADISKAPTADAIPLSDIEAYLQKKLEEWEALGERKWEPANAWGYNFIRACMDDLENYRKKVVDAWML